MSRLDDRLRAADPLSGSTPDALAPPALDGARPRRPARAPRRAPRLLLTGAALAVAAAIAATPLVLSGPEGATTPELPASPPAAPAAPFAYDTPAGRAFAEDDPRRWFGVFRRPRTPADELPGALLERLRSRGFDQRGERFAETRALRILGSPDPAYLVPGLGVVCLLVPIPGRPIADAFEGPRCEDPAWAARNRLLGGTLGGARRSIRYLLLPDGVRDVRVDRPGTAAAETVPVLDNLLYVRRDDDTEISFGGPGGRRIFLER